MTSENSANSSPHDGAELLALPSIVLEERRSVPTKGGVYFVDLETGAVFYIGRRSNMRARWNVHHRRHQGAAHDGVRIGWILVEPAAIRHAIEYQCVAAGHPLYQQGDLPVCQDTHGKRQWRIRVPVPSQVYAHLQEACADYHVSIPRPLAREVVGLLVPTYACVSCRCAPGLGQS